MYKLVDVDEIYEVKSLDWHKNRLKLAKEWQEKVCAELGVDEHYLRALNNSLKVVH